MKLLTFALLLFSLLCRAAEKPVKYGKDNKPVLELPYGRFEAFSKRDGLWTFKNIPFAAPPVGDLRWAKPQPPNNHTGLQKPQVPGVLPYPVWTDRLRVVKANLEHFDEYGNELDNFITWEGIGVKIGANDEFAKGNVYGEDCLNLDVVVPETALTDPDVSLPVVVWIWGGAYVTGGKEKQAPLLPLWDGYGLVKQSKGQMIYVTFNYRVGAFGFLGGATMEREAVPNVGLWDQRAAFQWVQDYIELVGGDPADVTAMGHSSGGSSVMHHLTAEGGTLDPLFKRAIIMSPAYVPMWDREGDVEDRFQAFAALAGCEGLGLQCLRTRSADQLQRANQDLAVNEVSATYAYGPVPDGSYIRQLPMLEWAQGNIWPIEKLILTHTSQETIDAVNTDTSKNGWSHDYLASLLPQRDFEAGWIDEVLTVYPYWNPLEAKWSRPVSRYQSELHRMQNIVLHSCFTCHMRWLIEALGEERVHLQYYSVYPFYHGADMLPLFWNDEDRPEEYRGMLGTVLRGIMALLNDHHEFIGKYRQYFINFITNKGEPSPADATIPWKHPVLGLQQENKTHMVGNVLGVAIKEPHNWETPVAEIEIGTMPKSKCEFWMDFYSNMSQSGNYSVSA